MGAKNFLTGTEFSRGDLLRLVEQGEELRKERLEGKLRNDLAGKSIALLFEKPSLRTHLSFKMAVHELGGHAIESYSLNRKKEQPEDVGRVVGGYCHAIMLRTHEHSILDRMAGKSPVPIINGLSDTHHPCQILADLLTLRQSYGKLEGLKLAYLGDGNNILHSLLLMAPYLGVNLSYSCPEGFEPSAFVLKQARRLAAEGGAKIDSFCKPEDAVFKTDAIYTDVWTSMGFEKEEEQREKVFHGYQLNKALYEKAKGSPLIMHCLPMVRGKEITEEMVEHPRSAIFQQSENRMHAQKALLLQILGNQ